MTPADRNARLLEGLAARLEPALQAAYLKALANLRAGLSLARIVALLESGDVDGVVREVFATAEGEAALRAIRVAYVKGVVSLMPETVKTLPPIPGRLRLRVEAPIASPHLIQVAQRFDGLAFRRLREDAREGLRTLVASELERGIGPRQVASALKSHVGAIGLTAYDEQIIASYRAALSEGRFSDALGRTLRDKRFDRSLRGALSTEQIETMTRAYRRKLVSFRAQTFARTSALQAANEASLASWEEAVASGAVAVDTIKRYWIVSEDERLCPICAAIPTLNANGVGLRDTFDTPVGRLLTPTAHPNCRCTTWVRLELPDIQPRPRPGSTRLILPKRVAA